MPPSSPLLAVLGEARLRGAIGPGPLKDQVAHALDFAAEGWPEEGIAVDLGSGGGLPGLPLALAYPGFEWILVDGRESRVVRLQAAIERLGLSGRVTARHERAEATGRSELRGTTDIVVARGFGPPAVTAECAAPLLRVGGRLVVSDVDDPTTAASRWPAAELAILGLVEVGSWRTGRGGFRAFEQGALCPDRYPRRPAAMARGVLFR